MKANRSRERALDLLAEASLHGLDPREERELGELLEDDHRRLRGSWERAAAAAHLALLPPSLSPLPSGLRSRLDREVQAHATRRTAPPPAQD